MRPDLIDTEGRSVRLWCGEMVRGVIANSDADLALAVSGITGPGGGTPEKPVGTVWFAWGRSGSAVVTRMLRFSGDREQVRRQAVAALRGHWISLSDKRQFGSFFLRFGRISHPQTSCRRSEEFSDRPGPSTILRICISPGLPRAGGRGAHGVCCRCCESVSPVPFSLQ